MDNFMTRMFSPSVRRREATAQQTEQTQVQSASASYTDKTVRIYRQDDALTNGAYYRALTLLAHTFGQMIPEYQKCDRAGGGNFVTETRGEAARHMNWLLQVRPNPLMTSVKLLENLVLQVIQQGNGVVYLQRNFDGDIIAMWLCQYAALNVMDNTYNLTYNAIGGARSLVGVPADSVLHLRNIFSYDHGLTGVPTLVYMRNALSLDATNVRLQTENAAKGGRQKVLLAQGDATQSVGLLGKFSKDQMKDAKEQLMEAMSDDVIVQPYGTTATPLQMSATEMDILASRNFTVGEVSRFTGVPKILLGDGSNSSYKSPEAALTELYKFAIQPIVREFEDEANSTILNEFDWTKHRIHLCERDLLRLDPMGQATLNEKLLGIGVKTINEIRKDYDQPAIEGGDEPFVTVQAQKVSTLGQQQPTELKPGNYTVKQPKQEPAATEPEEGKED